MSSCSLEVDTRLSTPTRRERRPRRLSSFFACEAHMANRWSRIVARASAAAETA